MDRLLPKRHGRPLDVQLPQISDVHDIVPAMAAIINRVNNGDLTPEEGSHLIDFLERCARLVVANDVVVRVEKVESQMKQRKTFDRLGIIFEALKRMEAGLPRLYKDQLKMVLKRRDIHLGWLRISQLAEYLRCLA